MHSSPFWGTGSRGCPAPGLALGLLWSGSESNRSLAVMRLNCIEPTKTTKTEPTKTEPIQNRIEPKLHRFNDCKTEPIPNRPKLNENRHLSASRCTKLSSAELEKQLILLNGQNLCLHSPQQYTTVQYYFFYSTTQYSTVQHSPNTLHCSTQYNYSTTTQESQNWA